MKMRAQMAAQIESGYAFQHFQYFTRHRMHFLPNVFSFSAVGAHEFVVELEVNQHAGVMPKKALRRRLC
jgi:hypothetical protein